MVKDNHPNLEKIWNQVPVDYYQTGIKNNSFQKIWHTGKLRAILDIIEISGVKPKKILDVGCASGWFLSKLAEKYPHFSLVGVDIYKPAIQYGRKVYKNLDLVLADGHKLPFKNNSFDLITCTEVLEHVVEPDKVLEEIKRVLKPNGIAIIEMDSGSFLFTMAWYWWTNLRRGVWRDSHIHTFNTKILENMIKNSGLIITQKKVFNYTMAVVFCLRKKLE